MGKYVLDRVIYDDVDNLVLILIWWVFFLVIILFLGVFIYDVFKEGKFECVKELIRVVLVMKNMIDECGLNLFYIVVVNGWLDCVKWLVVSGVDLGVEILIGYIVMYLVVMNGYVNCMMVSYFFLYIFVCVIFFNLVKMFGKDEMFIFIYF